MNRDQILAMPAGKEMDALVATLIMDWKNMPTRAELKRQCFHPSTSIADAFQVVAKTNGRFGYFRLHHERITAEDNHTWFCIFCIDTRAQDPICSDEDTAPLAICRAALLTTTGTVKEVATIELPLQRRCR